MNQQNKIEPDYSGYHILVVDGDEKFRKQAKNFLSPLGFKISEASCVGSAKDIIKSENISLVLSELRMPNESGVDLVKWVRRVYDTSFKQSLPMPFLIMTGFSHLLQQEDLDDYFLDGCLVKPLDEKEVQETTLIALKLKEAPKELTDKDQKSEEPISTLQLHKRDYCKVFISDLSSFKILHMDIYIQLSKNKYIQVGRKGEKVDHEQLKRYQEKDMEFLYVTREEYRKIVNFNLKLNKAVKQSDQITRDKKRQFMLKTGEIVLESTFVNGINPTTYNEAKEFLLISIGTLIEDENNFKLLQMLNNHSDSLYAHSLGVSLYSLMIAQRMGWRSGGNLFKLSLGALLHDIGKKDFAPELIQKPKSDITMAEKELLESHPERGREILENIKTIPLEIIAIAHEHHENPKGNGYPRQLKKNSINPMARIVTVADEFCYYAIKNPDFPDADAYKAIQILGQYTDTLIDLEAYKALQNVLQPQSKAS